MIGRLQYFGHLMRKADSLEKTLMLGKAEEIKNFSDKQIADGILLYNTAKAQLGTL